MIIHSDKEVSDYIYDLKDSLGSPTDFGVERFTGLVIGRFICVTHHCSYEWEYRHTCQKNTAIGIIKQADSGCTIRFFTTKGAFRPQFLVPAFLLTALCVPIFGLPPIYALQLIGIFSVSSLLSAGVEALTTPSKDGYKSLISLLKNPENPYENL